MSSRSVVARLARKVFVGDLKELFFITVRIIKILPETHRQKITLSNKKLELNENDLIDLYTRREGRSSCQVMLGGSIGGK